MAANTIARKLISLISLDSEIISGNPNTGTVTFRVDGDKFSCAVVEVTPTGVMIEMNGTGLKSRRCHAPKGLSFAGIALMIEFAAKGDLITAAA